MVSARVALGSAALLLALAGCVPPSKGPCTLPPAAELAVTATVPHRLQMNVSVLTPIRAWFNTCVDQNTLNAQEIPLMKGASVIAGAISYDPLEASVGFVPDAPLESGRTYLLSIMPGVRGANGESSQQPYFLSFSTRPTPDMTPPTTRAVPDAGTYPGPGMMVSLACDDGPGGTGCANTYWSNDGGVPTTDSTRYTGPIPVLSSTTLQFFSIDYDGNAESPQSVSYVIDSVRPTVLSTTPIAGATGVPPNAAITVVFSESMKPSVTSSVKFVPYLATDATYDDSTHTLTLTHVGWIDCATTYVATIGGLAVDQYGNGLASPYVWSFTGQTECDEPRTTASVPGGVHTAAQSVTLTCNDGPSGSGCARIAYTTDGGTPSFVPPNGTIVNAATAGPIAIPLGETHLRFRGQDAVGNTEVIKDQHYSISDAGFTWAADGRLGRGVGAVPATFADVTQATDVTRAMYRDATTGRLYRIAPNLQWTDDGLSWTSIPSAQQTWLVTTSVAAEGSRIYVGTNDGLQVSTNGGATFTKRTYGSGNALDITKVAISGKSVYAGTGAGLLSSVDRLGEVDRLNTQRVVDIEVSGSWVWALYDNGTVARSPDGGWSWSFGSAGGGAGHELTYLGGKLFVGTAAGLAVSTDNGATFTFPPTASTGLPAGYAVKLLGSGDGYVYANVDQGTNPRFYVSSNGGTTFTQKVLTTTAGNNIYLWEIFVEGATVHLLGWTHNFRSDDHGTTFTMPDPPRSADRLSGSQSTLYSITSSTISFTTNNGNTFTTYGIQDQGGPSTARDVYFDPSTGNVYVATMFGVAISQNSGQSWDVRTQANANLWQNSTDFVRAAGNTIWVWCSGHVMRSSNSGNSFNDLLVTTSTAYAMEVYGSTILAATTTGLQVSTNGGNAWALRTTANGLTSNFIEDVAMTPSGRIYARPNGGPVMFSDDNGATFTALTWAGTYSPTGIDTTGSLLHVFNPYELGISQDDGVSFTYRGDNENFPGGGVLRYLAP